MEEVTAYKSQDGQVFATVARCLEHEAQLKMERFFRDSHITSAEGFRRALVEFQDYVRIVLAAPDVIPEPTSVPGYTEEQARERKAAKSVLENYFENYDIEDIRDLNDFFVDHRDALATYFGFKF